MAGWLRAIRNGAEPKSGEGLRGSTVVAKKRFLSPSFINHGAEGTGQTPCHLTRETDSHKT